MSPETFVDLIEKRVRDSTSQGVVSLLEKPPGRKPDEKLVRLSKWFLALSQEDQEHLLEIIKMTSNHAVFGIFAVLDGVRVIEDDESRGELELRYIKDGQSVLLNNPDGPMLHELMSS